MYDDRSNGLGYLPEPLSFMSVNEVIDDTSHDMIIDEDDLNDELFVNIMANHNQYLCNDSKVELRHLIFVKLILIKNIYRE